VYESSLPILVLLQVSLFTYVLLLKNLNLFDSLIFSLLTTSLVIYILEIFHLNSFSFLILIITVIVLLILILYNLKRVNPALDFFQIPYYAIVIWIMIAIPQNFKFVAWDELSAWAHRSKWLYFNGSLWVKNQLTYFPEYPPILQFLHQIYLNPKGTNFSENAVMVAQMLLVLSLFGSIFLNHSKRNKASNYAGLLVGLLSPYFFGFNFFTLVPDFLLGLLFAYGLIRVHTLTDSKQDKFILFPLVAFIALLKPSGIIYALGIILYAYLRKFQLQKLAVLSLWTFFIYLSWQIYLGTNGIYNQRYTLAGISGKFFSYFTKNSLSTGQSGLDLNDTNPVHVLEKMFLDYFDGTIRFGLAFFALSVGLIFRYKPPRKLIFFGLTMWAACELMLFVTYMFLMSGYEADNTASHERYTATLFLAFTIVPIWKFFESEKETFQFLALSLVLLVNTIVPNNLFRDFEIIQPYPEAIEMRNEARITLKGISVEESFSILYVEQNAPSVGYTRLLVAYEAIPSKVEAGCWSFGEPYYPTDIWTCHGSLSAKISPQDFVVVGFGDAKFYRLLASENISYDKRLESGIFRVSTIDKRIVLVALRGKSF
jgi:hypothetical protein